MTYIALLMNMTHNDCWSNPYVCACLLYRWGSHVINFILNYENEWFTALELQMRDNYIVCWPEILYTHAVSLCWQTIRSHATLYRDELDHTYVPSHRQASNAYTFTWELFYKIILIFVTCNWNGYNISIPTCGWERWDMNTFDSELKLRCTTCSHYDHDLSHINANLSYIFFDSWC
jgi:hypothetical protein